MRRITALAILAILLGSALTGCGGGKDAAESAKDPEELAAFACDTVEGNWDARVDDWNVGMKKDARIRARGAEAAAQAAKSDSSFEPLAESMRALAKQSAIEAENWVNGATEDYAHDMIGDYSGDGTSFGPSLTTLTDARAKCEQLGTPTR